VAGALVRHGVDHLGRQVVLRALQRLRELGAGGAQLEQVVDEPAEPSELAEPLEGAEDYLAAEVVYAVTHEGARHLDDVLTRRTRISIEYFDRGVGAAPVAARLMAGELGWDDARTEDEVDHYLRRVEAERQSQAMRTDQEADEARVSAPDIV
jgi:glycerol-3-phosphate dehydrogenase